MVNQRKVVFLSKLQSLKREFYSAVQRVQPECQNNPNLFDPDMWPKFIHKTTADFFELPVDTELHDYAMKTAKEVCNRCEIKQQCLEFALATNQEVMVWGGLTPLERRNLK